VLIAPPACVAALAPGVTAGGGSAVVLPHSGHALFTALLGEAEHVFYWNMFSNSVLARVMNHRSAFFFAPGHLAHAIPSLPGLAVRHYYAGAAPTFLDPARPPSAAELARLAAEQDRALEGARAGVARSPSPAEMVARLLGEERKQS
jgi:hypothetical protein